MKVFISFAGAERDLARRVAKALQRSGLDVWFFEDEVLPGENWAAKLAPGLETADALVAILSLTALQSRLVRHDLDYALGNPRLAGRLIPVWVGPAAGLETESFPWILRRLELIQLPAQEQCEEGVERIVKAVHALALT